jgi:hypothetical protein
VIDEGGEQRGINISYLGLDPRDPQRIGHATTGAK